MGHHTYTPDADVAANTEIDLSDVLDAPLDVRGGNDPFVEGRIKGGDDDTSTAGTTVLSNTALASVGQGAAGDPAAGEVVFVDEYTIALGDALDNNSILEMAVEERGEVEQKV